MTPTYTLKELGALAGISRQRLHQLRSKGRGPAEIRSGVGKNMRVRIPQDMAISWMARRYPDRLEVITKLHMEITRS